MVNGRADPNMYDLVQRERPQIRLELGWKTRNVSEVVQDMTKVTMTD